MTDPSTLFLSAPQVRPSWTLNGLTLELNLAPTHVSNNDLVQTAVGDSVFAVTQSASFVSTNSLNGGVPAVSNATSAVTNAFLPSNPVVEQNMSQMNNCAGFYVSSVTTGTIEDASKKPVFLAPLASQQQVSESGVDKKKRQKTIAEGSSHAADAEGDIKSNGQAMSKKTPCQVAEITTSVVNEVRDNSAGAEATQTTTTIVSAAPITTTSVIASVPASKIATSSVPITANAGAAIVSNNGIPVGIAVARQRYVSSTTCKSQTHSLKETINAASTVSPYTSSVPYQPILEASSLFPPALSNIGVVAGAPGCDDRGIANIGGNILPLIAWPQQQQQQQQPWYPFAGAMETVPPACTGYQLVRDPVTGNIILIPSNQIGSAQSTATAGFTTTTNQQVQSFFIPQPFQQQQHQPQPQHQSQSHSLFLDQHLVSVVPSSTTNIKQNSVSTLLKLHDGVLTGVMMPCDLGKAPVVNPTQTTATIGQQLVSANNSSISYQFNTSNIHNPSMNAPHHFSSISSSGSLLIQQISGNASQSPLMNHNSVMIAESTAMQSVINTQPTYPTNGAPYLINAPVPTTVETTSAAVNQIQPAAAACIVSNSSQQTATYGQLPQAISELTKPTIVQSKIVNFEKQVNIATKLTDMNAQTWSPQSTTQILVGKTEENAVIKIDTNSIVQDASNQTEDSDDKDEDEEYANEDINDENVIVEAAGEARQNEDAAAESAVDQADSSRKAKTKRDKAVTNEETVYNNTHPDFTGLQLLLNGIEHVEQGASSSNVTTSAAVVAQADKAVHETTTDDSDKDTDVPAPNGLELLCAALADQEKNSSESSDTTSIDDDGPRPKTSRSRTHDLKPESRRFLSSKYKRRRSPSMTESDNELQQEVRKEVRKEMRMKLAEVAVWKKELKEFRAQCKKLKQLKSNFKRSRSLSSDDSPPTISTKSDEEAKTVKRKPGRPRKVTDAPDAKRAKCADTSLPAKPTIRPMKRPKLKLDKSSEEDVKVSNENNVGDLSPPVLEPMCAPPKSSKSLKSEVLSPPTLVANKIFYTMGPKGLADDNERLRPSEFEKKAFFHRLSGDDYSDEDIFKRKDTPESITKTLKRKVGRPRKYPKEGVSPSTESFHNHKPSANTKKSAQSSHKSSEKQIPVTSSVVSTFALLKSQRASTGASSADIEHKPKITPKLKAEAKFKTWRQKSPELSKDDLDLDFPLKRRKIDPLDSLLDASDRGSYSFTKRDKPSHPKEKHFPPLTSVPSASLPSKSSLASTVASSSTSSSTKPSSSGVTRPPKSSTTATALTEYHDKDFVLTPELLDASGKSPLRVLVPEEKEILLFRAGELSAVSPPDFFRLKLDGERERNVDIMTKEEVLMRDVVLEVKGKHPLPVGTRVCALWSHEYECLYPGTVTSFSSLDLPEDEKYTAVDFDDNDSGPIKNSDIRVLPQYFGRNRKEDSDESEACGNRKRQISSGVKLDEIPADKQVHSPDRSPSHHHKIDTQNVPASSSAVEAASLPSGSAISDIEKPASSDSMDKKKNSERKKLKKKHKEKTRDNADSPCKRKSHKHRSDTDEGSSKKRHKHKHKHHKHHKRKRSHDERCESDSHKCSSKSHAKASKVDKFLDWTSVPPYSSHLTEAKKPTELSSKAKEKTEPTPINLKNEATKKVKEEATGEPEKVEIKRIRHRKSVDYTASKDSEMTAAVTEDNAKEANSSVGGTDAAKEVITAVATEQADSSPSDETDGSSSSRRGSDSTSDSDSSSSDRFWEWHGKGIKRNGKGRGRKEFYKSIKRGDVIISVGDCAVFLTAGNSARPFIGRIESMWESYNNMMVRVKWFYHPEETTGLKKQLPYLGALFESPHDDKNDVQTISHKCDVISLSEYRERLKKEPERAQNVYESNDLYYLAGHYDPTAKRLKFKDDVFP